MQDDVVALFAYDRWANTKVLDACRKLTAEQYVAEPVPAWSSVRSTIYHIAMVTEFHLRTLAGALAAEASWRSCWDFVTGRLASPTGTPYCIAPLPCWAAR